MRLARHLAFAFGLLMVSGPVQADGLNIASWLERCVVQTFEEQRTAETQVERELARPYACATTLVQYCKHAEEPSVCAGELRAVLAQQRQEIVQTFPVRVEGDGRAAERVNNQLAALGSWTLEPWREAYTNVKSHSPGAVFHLWFLSEEDQVETFAETQAFASIVILAQSVRRFEE